MTELTADERDLLQWLSEAEYSQYGECYGAALDVLIKNGLAQIHKPGERDGGFIAQGRDMMYRAVSLTEAGRKAVRP